MHEASQTRSRDELIPLLERVELFRGLPTRDLRRVAEVVTGLTVNPGEVIFEAGEPAEACYIVMDGAVELIAGSGPDAQVREVLRSREAFGETALVGDAPRPTTARAAGDTTLAVVRRDALHGVIGRDSLPMRLLTRTRAERPEPPAPEPPGGDEATEAPGVHEAGGTPGVAETTSSTSHAASRLIQKSMLMRDVPGVPGFDIAAGTTLEELGRGHTVWDAVSLPDGRAALMVLEVRADGLPAAYVVGTARAAVRAAVPGSRSLAETLARANDALAGIHVDGVDQFVECAVVVPDAEGIEWACAGRIPAGVLGRDGTFTQLGSHGPPLGMMAGFSYGTERAAVGSGSSVLVLSGGGTGLFRGAADLVAEVQGKPAGDVVGTIHRAVRKARGGQEISVLFLRRH